MRNLYLSECRFDTHRMRLCTPCARTSDTNRNNSLAHLCVTGHIFATVGSINNGITFAHPTVNGRLTCTQVTHISNYKSRDLGKVARHWCEASAECLLECKRRAVVRRVQSSNPNTPENPAPDTASHVCGVTQKQTLLIYASCNLGWRA
jgi:hypothetical protein